MLISLQRLGGVQYHFQEIWKFMYEWVVGWMEMSRWWVGSGIEHGANKLITCETSAGWKYFTKRFKSRNRSKPKLRFRHTYKVHHLHSRWQKKICTDRVQFSKAVSALSYDHTSLVELGLWGVSVIWPKNICVRLEQLARQCQLFSSWVSFLHFWLQ